MRGAAATKSTSDVLDSIRVVAVNGDALLCEYSVCLTGQTQKKKSRGPTLERERCVARAAAPETERAETEEARFAENEKTENTENTENTNASRPSREGSPDHDAGPSGPATLDSRDPWDPGTGIDLSASMSASMGQSLFLAKK